MKKKTAKKAILKTKPRSPKKQLKFWNEYLLMIRDIGTDEIKNGCHSHQPAELIMRAIIRLENDLTLFQAEKDNQ